MNSFHFLRPAWLLALPPLLFLLIWRWRCRLRSRSWQAVCDPELLPHLLLGRSRRRANWPLWLLLCGGLLAVLALAGPAWRKQPQPLFRQQSALVVLFDLSRSMAASDLKPNRLERARLKIEDLLNRRREGQTALVAFAGDAFVVTPLTDDTNTIRALLQSLDPQLMPVQGSEPQRAVTLGIQLLQQAGLRKGRLLLVTDEDRPERVTATARDLHQRGYELAVLGVGTTDGAPVPLPQGGFLKDNRGSLVLPKLEEPGLRRLAAEGGGAYRRLNIDDSDLQKLLEGLETHRMDKAEAADGKTGQRWREEGVWLLWPLVLLGAFAFRRGWLLMLAMMLLQPLPARAFSWQDLWLRPDQQAADAFSAEQYEQAGKLFKDPRWRASALYRDGRYREAAETLKKPQSADDWYNQGNALAHSGQLSQALQAYNKALELQPEHADARYNLDLVQQALQQQQNRQQSDEQQRPSDESSHAGQQAGKQPGKQQNDSSPSSRAAEDRDGQEGNVSSEAGSPESQPTPRSGRQADNTSAAGQKPQQKGQKTLQNRQKAAGRQDQAEAAPPRQTTSQNEGNPVPGADAEARTEEKSDNDRQQAVRHWLRRIPDDPGGLLRRKFLYQYRQRDRQLETDRPW